MSGNEQLALHIVQEAVNSGVSEFCICPGARNAPLYTVLMYATTLKKYLWCEERSAAFFALGRARATNRPVAVITTSGTAAGELLPAAMEAYYSGVPLLLITADRPRRFRGSGAPQTAEQVGLYGIYAPFAQDIAVGETCELVEWDFSAAAHLNVCFEEPFPQTNSPAESHSFIALHAIRTAFPRAGEIPHYAIDWLDQFFQKVKHPFIVVSTLKPEAREAVAAFLLHLNAPVYLEGVSGIREDKRLQHLRIRRSENIFQSSDQSGYNIDGVLRIGGVPTFRMWRDLEEKQGKVTVCSISDVPFSGLSWADVIHTPVNNFFEKYSTPKRFDSTVSERWRAEDQYFYQKLVTLFEQEPTAEPSLIHFLSNQIPINSNIYLGNSLPIREWDQAACEEERNFQVTASRGLNGIDGQISTFFGLCQPLQENWAILGDLTTLYDLAAPWILPQLDASFNLVVINNKGGQIFSRFLPEKEFINSHDLEFAPVAHMWGMDYERWEKIPPRIIGSKGRRLIEIVPDLAASDRFHQKLATF